MGVLTWPKVGRKALREALLVREILPDDFSAAFPFVCEAPFERFIRVAVGKRLSKILTWRGSSE